MTQTIRGRGIGTAILPCPAIGMDDTGHVGLRTRLARRAWRYSIIDDTPS